MQASPQLERLAFLLLGCLVLALGTAFTVSGRTLPALVDTAFVCLRG